jgi:sugar lactone lactonase YvrE
MHESPAFEVVVEAGNLLGESPVWDEREQALWWVDIHGRSLHRWREGQGHGAWPLPEQTGCIGLCARRGFVSGTRTGFVWFEGPLGERRTLVQPLAGASNLRFNDGRCDPAGRFWSATVHELREVGGAALYRLTPDATALRALDGLTVGNGLAFSPDRRTLYVADSHVREIHAIDFDAARGALGARRLFARLQPEWGRPDGATVDAEGGLWIAAIEGGRVLRFLRDGTLDRELRLPVSQPTSVQFGGDGFRTLFVTSARMKLDDAALREQPLAGSVFALDVGVAGVPEPRFDDSQLEGLAR